MLCPVFVFVAQCRVKFLTNFHQPKKTDKLHHKKNFKACSALPNSELNLNCNLSFDQLHHSHTVHQKRADSRTNQRE